MPWSDFDPLDAVLSDVAAALLVRFDDHALALAVEDFRAVSLGIDLNFVVMGVGPLGNLGHDLHRLAGGEQAVHAGGADADALLPAAHAHAVEFGAVKQLAKNQRDLLANDAGSVVLHADLEAVLADALDMDPDFREDAGLFAGVQGVIDRLFDGSEQGLAGIVEAQQVAVLGEELADGDFLLARRHRLRGGAAAGDCPDFCISKNGTVPFWLAVGLGQFAVVGGGCGRVADHLRSSLMPCVMRAGKTRSIIANLPVVSRSILPPFSAEEFQLLRLLRPFHKDSPARTLLAERLYGKSLYGKGVSP